MTLTLRTFSIAALVALPLLNGCGGGSSSSSTASVRLVNATSDYAALDLYWSTNSVSANVASYAAGTYGGVDAGSQVLSLRPNGTTTTIASGTYSLGGDTNYTIVGYIAPSGALTGALLSESEGAPSSGTAKFRIFNTVSYTPTGATTAIDLVDVYVTTLACSTLPTNSVAAQATGVRALGAYTEIAATSAGTAYNVCITGAGDRADLRLSAPSMTLKDQQITTLVLTTTPGGVLVNGVQIDQQGSVTARTNTSARVRLVADAAGGAAVTASIASSGGASTTLATALASPTVASYTLVPAGTLTPSVRIGSATVTAPTFTAAPGADFTLLVAGTSTVTAIADNNKPSTTSARPTKIRLLNGLNGYAGTPSLLVNFEPAASGVAFATASSPYALPASTGAVVQALVPGLTPATLTLPGDNVTLASGRVYTAFILGDAASPNFTLRLDR